MEKLGSHTCGIPAHRRVTRPGVDSHDPSFDSRWLTIDTQFADPYSQKHDTRCGFRSVFWDRFGCATGDELVSVRGTAMLRQPRPLLRVLPRVAVLTLGLLIGGLVANSLPVGASGIASKFSWSIVPTPNTSPSENNSFMAVTCVSSSDCWAVGDGGPNGNGHPLAEHWNGTAWSIVATPSAAASFAGVSCIGSSDCWAVGEGNNGTMLADHWNGSAWSTIATPSSDAVIYGISCPSSTDCWVVGQGTNGGAAQTFAEHWNGTAWSIASMPDTSPSQNNELFSVTCVSISDCWAVGSVPSITELTLIEHWNGLAWSIVPSPNGAKRGSTRTNHLSHVTCVSTSDCWAVGSKSHMPTSASALTEHWNGTAWFVVRARHLPGRPNEGLSGVSCSSSSDCWAVGGGGPRPPFQSLAVHWNGQRWTLVAAPANGLAAVYCVSSLDCWAVGAVPGSGVPQTLAEHGV